jgi:hypothetical protein
LKIRKKNDFNFLSAGGSMVDIIDLNGMDFSTLDRDNDRSPTFSCGEAYGGGWWYAWCANAFLNGPWISWYPKVDLYSKVKTTAMMIKPH